MKFFQVAVVVMVISAAVAVQFPSDESDDVATSTLAPTTLNPTEGEKSPILTENAASSSETDAQREARFLGVGIGFGGYGGFGYGGGWPFYGLGGFGYPYWG